MIGHTLGPYAVLAKLGAGGMGEVYRARDERLGRQVALKILPDTYVHDPERLARFRREAQALAALNHPNIAQIYGLEDTGERHALVLELVEGPTLAEAIATSGSGGLGVRESLEIARQIIDALEAAHAQGIVHRDLKPANIKVNKDTNDGTITVKVLDFGLAKALASDDSAVTSGIANSPTITSPATAHGVILGTAGYMAPEQAMGRVADKRADIWAFGVVLYEMLAGRRPFQGQDAGTLLTESLTADADLRALPADTPASVRRLIGRCLEKHPRRRLRDIADARFELDERVAADTPAGRQEPARPRASAWIAWALAAALAIALAFAILWPRPAARGQAAPIRFTLNGPDGNPVFADFAISPDGRAVAFNVITRGQSAVWIRAFETLQLTELPGSANARSLFWSPDSKSIGFFADGKIRTINVISRVHAVACDTPADGGAAWGRDGLILHGTPTGIRACGRDAPLTVVQGEETAHRSPWFLPDGRHFVYLTVTPSSAELRVGSIDEGGRTAVIGPSDSNAVYADGHLLFTRSGVLLAQPFDVATLTTSGDAFPITDEMIGVPVSTRRARLSASTVGTIGYTVLDDRPAQLTWFNRAGVSTGTVGSPMVLWNMDLSPDEGRLVVSRRRAITESTDIWIVDLARSGQAMRVTDHPAAEFDPIWSRDGRTLVFNSNRAGSFDLYRRPADGSGSDELLLKHESGLTTPDWSRTHDLLLYSVGADSDNADIWMMRVGSGEKPAPFLETPSSESRPALSPDGQWVAYMSNASGRNEVYVRAFAGGTAAVPVSLDGGGSPRWRGDGGEIFFLAPDRSMMAARVETANGIRIADPVRLFGTEIVLSDGHPYVVSKDGQRFLFGVRQGTRGAIGATILINWLSATRR